MANQSPFSLLVRDDFLISKRMKNQRAKGEREGYTVPKDSWDPFENLLGESLHSREFPQAES